MQDERNANLDLVTISVITAVTISVITAVTISVIYVHCHSSDDCRDHDRSRDHIRDDSCGTCPALPIRTMKRYGHEKHMKIVRDHDSRVTCPAVPLVRASTRRRCQYTALLPIHGSVAGAPEKRYKHTTISINEEEQLHTCVAPRTCVAAIASSALHLIRVNSN